LRFCRRPFATARSTDPLPTLSTHSRTSDAAPARLWCASCDPPVSVPRLDASGNTLRQLGRPDQVSTKSRRVLAFLATGFHRLAHFCVPTKSTAVNFDTRPCRCSPCRCRSTPWARCRMLKESTELRACLLFQKARDPVVPIDRLRSDRSGSALEMPREFDRSALLERCDRMTWLGGSPMPQVGRPWEPEVPTKPWPDGRRWDWPLAELTCIAHGGSGRLRPKVHALVTGPLRSAHPICLASGKRSPLQQSRSTTWRLDGSGSRGVRPW